MRSETLKAHFLSRLFNLAVCHLKFSLMFKSELLQINFIRLQKKLPKSATSHPTHLQIGSPQIQLCPPKTVNPHNPTLLWLKGSSQRPVMETECSLQCFIFQQVHWNTQRKPCLDHTYIQCVCVCVTSPTAAAGSPLVHRSWTHHPLRALLPALLLQTTGRTSQATLLL